MNCITQLGYMLQTCGTSAELDFKNQLLLSCELTGELQTLLEKSWGLSPAAGR